jgi:hypothetical protein
MNTAIRLFPAMPYGWKNLFKKFISTYIESLQELFTYIEAKSKFIQNMNLLTQLSQCQNNVKSLIIKDFNQTTSGS